ncbi:DNA primase [Streptomyces sp. NPDC047315]|uniref:DNA primase n=1 Tax=Streptomyces sp. NPDC047315 TaxID=3155142 RepID=UPI0034020653
MKTTVCEREGCEAALPVAGRGPVPRFCSTCCRVAAHRARRKATEPPQEMTSRRRWVRRSARKVPLQPSGRPALSTSPATWSSYRTVAGSSVGVGLGYVLGPDDGIVCIDLDHCLHGGQLAQWAREVVDRCSGTYIEVSPSGDGLHIFGRAQVVKGRRIVRDGRSVEVYGQGRYIAMTGQRFEDAPAELADLSEVVASLV